MKAHIKRVIIVLAFVVIFLISPYLLGQKQIEKTIKKYEAGQKVLSVQSQGEGLPRRLRIPSISVDTVIEYVGITSSGVMDVPSRTDQAGWFSLGSRPGELGSAVIAGHFDGGDGKKGVFSNLFKLKEGDKLYLEDDNGITITFIVRASRIYSPGYAEEVFSLNDKAHLNLVTCDGIWDGDKKSYSKRLVVFTDIAN